MGQDAAAADGRRRGAARAEAGRTRRREGRLKHAILGAGGVGGFIGAILGHAGHDVTLLLRPQTLGIHPGTLSLTSTLGTVSAPVARAATLMDDVDVLWVTVKATQLASSLAAVPDAARAGVVVPLLNGVDHVAVLRSRFGERVIAATFAGESERVAPGRIAHTSPFAHLVFHDSGRPVLDPVARTLQEFGCVCSFEADEATLLWRKLVMLAPFALTTSALGGTIGAVRESPEWRPRLLACAREACQVARAAGAGVDEAATLGAFDKFPGSMRSSMSKDVAAGLPPELDAIAGPVLRGGARSGIAVPATTWLEATVRAVKDL